MGLACFLLVVVNGLLGRRRVHATRLVFFLRPFFSLAGLSAPQSLVKAGMAAPLLFYDLSLLPSSFSSSGDGGDGNSNSSSSSRLQLLAATARALELGYAAVALDHPHRGLLADSHRCRTEPFAPLSSLPLPSSAALHRRRLASPASEPFRQYTRITLSLDSAAATASALAPSASRLLRTYDLVAARPHTQAAFDHLCQAPLSAQHLDLISIDFSSHGKLPFRIKPPMLKLALQKGLHFEIAYSPLISTDVNAKRNLIAEVKVNVILLVPNDPTLFSLRDNALLS